MPDSSAHSLKVLMLGVGDFFSRKYYSTSFLLLYGEAVLLVDCPSPLRRMLYDASRISGLNYDLSQITDVLITHIHGDHSNGLESLGFYKRFVENIPVTVHTIPEVSEVLWEHKLKASMYSHINLKTQETAYSAMEDYFTLSILKPDIANSINGIEVFIRYTRHYVPCIGIKAGYNGKWVGYSSDTIFDPAHIEFLADCDLIFHETNAAGHTPYEKLLALPEDIKKKMLLVHIPDDFDTSASEIECAREGMLYEL